MKTVLFFCLAIFFGSISCSSDNAPFEPEIEASQIYFPPTDSDNWETATAGELGWHQEQLPALLDYLKVKHTKSFIVLYKTLLPFTEDTNRIYWRTNS